MGTINASKVKTPRKTALWIALFLALGTALGVGIWFFTGRGSGETVYVYPFQFIGMTEYWGDSQESHGPVTTDKIQTVFLSDTQNVTEVFVEQGDLVKKGDLLMTFDTTLSDLQLERKRLSVEKLKLQLEDAKDELKRINCMKPMVIPESSDDETEEEVPENKFLLFLKICIIIVIFVFFIALISIVVSNVKRRRRRRQRKKDSGRRIDQRR